MRYRLGIDVGGTNTDAVILDENNTVLGGVKTATTHPVVDGINAAVGEVLTATSVAPSSIAHAMLGTTHATNAIVQRRGLAKVGVLRISGPSGYSIPPFIDWPSDIIESLGGAFRIVAGGYEYNGAPIGVFDEKEVRAAIREMHNDHKIEALAISGAFSLVNGEQEDRAEEIAREEFGDTIPISVSHRIGSIGLIERENATILNAAIQAMAAEAYGSFEDVLSQHGIDAQLFITQNDGTLMNIAYAKRYPVLTIASGPTNSLRGAAFLSGIKDAIVIDVGGTTTDVGILKNGFPRESGTAVEIGGVTTNFRMPDLLSIGLGGGSIVRRSGDSVTIGPDSVGYRIQTDAVSFGGSEITTTDIAIAAGNVSIPDAKPSSQIDNNLQTEVTQGINGMIETAIDTVKTVLGDVPVVVVGGGSILVPSTLTGATSVTKPEHFAIANAIGAAIAQVSGQVDGVFDVATKGRDAVVEEVKQLAIDDAVNAGAQRETVEIVEIDEIPLAYLPSNAVRFRAKAAGSLETTQPGGERK